MYERRTSEEQLSRFEDERRVWHEEKEKVKKKAYNFNLHFYSVLHKARQILNLSLIIMLFPQHR